MRRRLSTGLVFLGLGLGTTLTTAWLLAVFADVQQGRETQGTAYVDEVQWSVTRWDRAGAIQIKSIRIKGANWSPQQAAGAPDTPTVGDQTSAWASKSSDGGTEWLILSYAKAVVAKEVDVYESCAPGALFKVTVFDEGDHEIEAWSGSDPSMVSPSGPSASGVTPVSKVPVSVKVRTRKIKLYLACDKVPGWNEVDAVGLIGEKDDLQWARSVQASSTYASGFGTTAVGGDPATLIPSWSGLRRASDLMVEGTANREERQVDARGWPMVAMMSESDALTSGAGASVPAATVNTYSSSLRAMPSGGSFAVVTPNANRAPVPMPMRPIWRGLIADTVLFGAVWLVVWSVLTVPRRFVREVGRIRRGACLECGYDLGYDFIRGCPECGWRRDRSPLPMSMSPATPPRRTPAPDATSVR